MKNVQMQVKGDLLTITINLKEDFGPSASGKTRIVASTGGNAEIPGHPDLRLGLNVFRKV